MSRDDQLVASALRRFLKLGGLAGRVGASMLGAQVRDLTRLDLSGKVRTAEALVRNATRVAETLGEMKGAAMKLGQMLSLHGDLLPPEVAEILRTLQKEAPSVPFEVMRYEVEGALGDRFERVFEHLEPEPMASASIGQVHLARLRDGRRVAVKIQYPLIAEIVKADLKNLKRLLQTLFSLISSADFDPIWEEVRDRLLEEIDYEREAGNMDEMASLHADVAEVVVPRVVREASARNVLTMEYVGGVSPDDACSDRQPRELRDRWGQVLFEFEFRGLFRHRLLHADPNLANFAFLEDGRVVVYDHGCLKRIPAEIARGYARLMLAAAERRKADVPAALREMGVHKSDGGPLAAEITDPYVDICAEIVRERPPYTFGENKNLYRELWSLGLANMSEAADLRFPRDVVFIDRTLGGHFGNLSRLRATGPWRELLMKYVRPVAEKEA